MIVPHIITGDPDTVIETAREYWQAFEEEGLLTGWECQPFQPTYENIREKMRDKYSREGGQRAYELRAVAAAATVDCLKRFDERLPAVGESGDENPVPIAFWTMIHFMMKHQGYD